MCNMNFSKLVLFPSNFDVLKYSGLILQMSSLSINFDPS